MKKTSVRQIVGQITDLLNMIPASALDAIIEVPEPGDLYEDRAIVGIEDFSTGTMVSFQTMVKDAKGWYQGANKDIIVGHIERHDRPGRMTLLRSYTHDTRVWFLWDEICNLSILTEVR